MSTVMLVTRLALAAVFAIAGAAKLFDRDGSRRAAAEFGAPVALAGALAVALPLAELAAAGLLLPASTALVGALLAAALLAGFSGAIATQIARGRAPDCHCFGQLHSAPAGPATLARNGALLALAIFVAAAALVRGDAGTSAIRGIADADAAVLAAVAASAIAASALALALALLRRHGALLLRVDTLESALAEHGIAAPEGDTAPVGRGLPPETPAPPFELPRADGGRASLGDLLAGREGALLVFADPSCGPCNALMPDVASWQRALAGHVEVAVVTRAGGQAKDGLRNVLIQDDREVARAYEVTATPTALVVDADGNVASALAEGADAIRQLVAELGVPADAAAAAPEPPPLQVVHAGGSSDLELEPDGETVLLFWRSTCGFCDRMLPELREFAARPAGERRPIVVVTGAGDRGPDVGLRVVEDPDGRLASSYGARGTPMAVLVDASGQALTPVAAGAQAAFELATIAGDDSRAQSA